MSGLPLIVEPEAADDYRDAALWYESQAPGLAGDFAREIERALEKLSFNPTLYPVIHQRFHIRRVLVSRFPFKIFYVVQPGEIRVKAILHTSQDDWILQRRFLP